MRTASLVQPALWLLAWSVYSSPARAELAPASSGPHDVRPLSRPLSQHPAIHRDDVQLLLERARQSVEDAAEEHEGFGSVKVVRETFVVPVGSKVGRRTGGDGGTGSPAVQASTKPKEAADILKTVGKLKALRPLFTWAIHHPLRFLYHYALVPLAKLILLALTALLRLLLALVLAAVSPIQTLISLATTPLVAAWNTFAALAPLWWALGGALTFGAGLGLVAGLVAGRTTREIIDDTVDRTTRTLRWLGVLEKKPKAGPGGYGEGARLEKVPSAPLRRMSDKARGKQRWTSGPFDDHASYEALDDPPVPTISTSPRLSPLLQRFKRQTTAYSSAHSEGPAYVDYSRQGGGMAYAQEEQEGSSWRRREVDF
ncbi:hypothetical protein JCM10296v2_000223 [Rhodotorula toruloides]